MNVFVCECVLFDKKERKFVLKENVNAPYKWYALTHLLFAI